MELLSRTLRSCRRVVGHNGWFAFFLVGALIGLEMVGRHTTTSDWHDVILASLLGVILLGTLIRHRENPLPWLQPAVDLGQWIWSRLKDWLIDIGYDLRGEPPVRRGMPPILFAIVSFLLGWTGLLLIFRDDLPQSLRFFGVNYFYLGYLALMSVVWAVMCLGISLSFWLTVGLIHDEFAMGSDGLPRGPSRAGLFLSLATVLLLGSRVFYLWQVLGASMAMWLVLSLLAFFGGERDSQFLWRPRGSVRVWSVSVGQTAVIMYSLATAIAINLILTATGVLIWRDPLPTNTTMPLTIVLGTMLGWVLLALLATLIWQSLASRLRSPSRFCRRVLQVRGANTHEIRRTIRRRFPWTSWRVHLNGNHPDACAAQIEIVDPARSEAHEFDPVWPLKLSLDDLNDPMVLDRIERRSDIQARRRMMSGLERLFKAAHRRKYRNGHGFVLAPHLSLFPGLRRDEPEPEPGPFDSYMVIESIGPPYHRAFPRLVRSIAHRMMRTLQIDLVFVEDGVNFRRFSRVMRRLFELYDKHDGRRGVSDQDFVGLHGTKVIVYEMQFDNQFESDVYPEPKFVALGRARVLLVFRDRSEHEELVEPPFDASRTPAPIGIGS